MTLTSSEPAPHRTTVFWQWAYRLCAVTLLVGGIFLLAYNLNRLPAEVAVSPALMLTGAIMAGAVVVATIAALAVGFPAQDFAVARGEYTAGQLVVNAGMADVCVTAETAPDRLAAGRFGSWAGPRFRAGEGMAQLTLDRRAAAPFVEDAWRVGLARDLPWSLTLNSSLGCFKLDLGELTVTRLLLRSLAGNVDLTLPAGGRGEMDLRLTLGDLTVRLPQGVAVKIRLTTGFLASGTLDPQRFISVGVGEWVTPNFSAAPQQWTLNIRLAAGDLRLGSVCKIEHRG